MVRAAARNYSEHVPTRPERSNAMNVLKHMEAIFLVSLAVAGPVTVALDVIPDAHARQAVAVNAAPAGQIPVVVISGKRMTEAEKQQSLEEEARLADVRTAGGSRI
jgi:hypothetical protein